MPLSVIVMPLPTGVRYKARVGAPWNVTAEADDADSAYRVLTDSLRARAPTGIEFKRIDVPRYDRLFDVVGGLDPNSPAWSAWASEVDAYRAEVAERDETVGAEHGG